MTYPARGEGDKENLKRGETGLEGVRWWVAGSTVQGMVGEEPGEDGSGGGLGVAWQGATGTGGQGNRGLGDRGWGDARCGRWRVGG